MVRWGDRALVSSWPFRSAPSRHSTARLPIRPTWDDQINIYIFAAAEGRGGGDPAARSLLVSVIEGGTRTRPAPPDQTRPDQRHQTRPAPPDQRRGDGVQTADDSGLSSPVQGGSEKSRNFTTKQTEYIKLFVGGPAGGFRRTEQYLYVQRVLQPSHSVICNFHVQIISLILKASEVNKNR